MANKLIKIYLLWFFFSQTVDKLKKELENDNISIIAVEGFEEQGDVSFQMEKLKVIHLYVVLLKHHSARIRNVAGLHLILLLKVCL